MQKRRSRVGRSWSSPAAGAKSSPSPTTASTRSLAASQQAPDARFWRIGGLRPATGPRRGLSASGTHLGAANGRLRRKAGLVEPSRHGAEAPEGCASRHNELVRVERSRENVFTVTATSQELSALVAGARMALEAMRTAPEPPPPEATQILERVLREFDQARARLAADASGGS